MFRWPKMERLAPTNKFMIVMEPIRGQIYRVDFEVATDDPFIIADAFQLAWGKMKQKIAHTETSEEAAVFKADFIRVDH